MATDACVHVCACACERVRVRVHVCLSVGGRQLHQSSVRRHLPPSHLQEKVAERMSCGEREAALTSSPRCSRSIAASLAEI